jgi:phage/plasmid-associated DNA primase
MVIRDAIVAHTDTALEADVPKAAEHMLAVLDYCERLDEHGKVQSLSNFEDLGLFLYYVWRRVARYGFDRTQSSAAHQWTFYLFNGATYERGQFEQLHIKAKEHVRMIIGALAANVQMKTRVISLEAKCKSTDFVSRSIAEMQLSFKYVERLARCGLVSPNDFQLELDMGNYIGFKNGVYDILNDRFLPRGSVPLNVLVSMCTNYDYVGPDDAKFPEARAQIEEFYRKLHADDYENPNDERLAAMWLLAGSLLFRGNVCKKAFVFLGSEGDNGKSTFTELIQLTLGDYAVTGNRSSLSGTQEQMTLDPDLVANHKSLVCTFPEVQSIEAGVSSGFKFNCGKLKALTGNDEQSVRGLYRDKKGIIIGFKPILHSNFMAHARWSIPTTRLRATDCGSRGSARRFRRTSWSPMCTAAGSRGSRTSGRRCVGGRRTIFS